MTSRASAARLVSSAGQVHPDALVEVRVEDQLLRAPAAVQASSRPIPPPVSAPRRAHRVSATADSAATCQPDTGASVPNTPASVGTPQAWASSTPAAKAISPAEVRRQEAAGPRVHHAGHQRVEHRRAGVLQLDQHEGGHDLGVGLRRRCPAIGRGSRRAGVGHRHDADRQPGLGQDEGALHALAVLGERRDRADQGRERRPRPHRLPRRRPARAPSRPRSAPSAHR